MAAAASSINFTTDSFSRVKETHGTPAVTAATWPLPPLRGRCVRYNKFHGADILWGRNILDMSAATQEKNKSVGRKQQVTIPTEHIKLRENHATLEKCLAVYGTKVDIIYRLISV